MIIDPRSLALASVATLAAGCGGSTPAPAPIAASAEPAPFGFDWTLPCRVPVETTYEGEGHRERLRYLIDVGEAAQGGRRVALADPELIEGKAPSLRSHQDLLTFVVARDGTLVRVDAVDAMYDRFLAEVGVPDDQAAAARAQFALPMWRRLLVEQVGDEHWGVWVGRWVGWSLEPGEVARATRIETLPSGATIEVEVEREHLGGADGLVRLRYTETIGTAGWRVMLDELTAEASPGAPSGSERIDEARHVRTWEAELEPATLRTHRATYSRQSRVREDGASLVDEHPSRTVSELDWSRAEGCGVTAS